MSVIDSATAKRHRVDYRGDNLYVICVYQDGRNLSEIMLCQSTGGIDNICTTAGLEFIAALVNELIAAGQLERVGALAAVSSLGSRTLPGIIAQIVKDHAKLPEVV